MTHTAALLIGAAAALVAGLVQGASGFGFALVLTPILVLLGDAGPAVFTSVALGTPLSLFVVWQARADLPRRELWALTLPALLLTPLGTRALVILPGAAARLAAALTALGGGLLMLAARRPMRIRTGIWPLPLAGMLGGFLTGLTGMGGPPVALMVAARGTRLQAGRGLLAAFNLVSYVIAASGLLGGPAIGRDSLFGTLLLAPFAVLGMWMGSRIARGTRGAAYGQVAPVAAAVAAAIALLGLLRG